MKSKHWLGAGLAAMVLCVPFPSMAETISNEKPYEVSFTGKAMEANFTAGDLDQVIYSMEPGDEARITIEVANKADQTSDWYMENAILKSLEDASDMARGGAYGYYLSYEDAQGKEEVIFDSQKVGGDGAEGLHQAGNSLEEYFYMDRLAPGETGTVRLKVLLEGETQGNAYQNTLAKLQMSFGTELVTEPENNPPETPGTPGKKPPYIIQTGDSSVKWIWVSLGLLVLGSIVMVVTSRGRKGKEDEKHEKDL